MNTESSSSQSSFLGLDAPLMAPTYYDILNVDPAASRLMIREAYLRLKSLYTNGSDGLYGVSGGEDLKQHLEELEAAFDVLNDDKRRAEYDRRFVAKGGSASSHQDSWNVQAELAQPSDVIQTSRSTLRVIKTKARGSDDKALQTRFIEVLDQGDPTNGSILVSLREAAEVSEQEIQERTKISLEYIRSMENNRYDRLPQVVYVKGFLRSYLRYLNVPQLEKVVSAYASKLEAWQSGQKT